MPTAARRERLCHLSAGSSVQQTLPAAVPWLMQLSQPPSWRWAAATCPKETVPSAVWPNISMLPKSWGQYGCSLSRMVVRRTDSTDQIAYSRLCFKQCLQQFAELWVMFCSFYVQVFQLFSWDFACWTHRPTSRHFFGLHAFALRSFNECVCTPRYFCLIRNL